jgi:hypothetical protein
MESEAGSPSHIHCAGFGYGMKEVLLKRLSFAAGAHLPEWMQNLEIDAHSNHVGDLVIKVCKHVYAEERIDQIDVPLEYKVPENWFEHLKEDHAPWWVVDRWPVRYTTVKKLKRIDLKQHILYPSIPEPSGKPTVLKMMDLCDGEDICIG